MASRKEGITRGLESGEHAVAVPRPAQELPKKKRERKGKKKIEEAIAPPTPELTTTRKERPLSRDELKEAVTEGVKLAMLEALPVVKAATPYLEFAEDLNAPREDLHIPANAPSKPEAPVSEVAQAAERFRGATHSFFSKYHKALGFIAALGIGALGGGAAVNGDVQERPGIEQSGDRQMELVRAVLPEVLRSLHTAVPADHAGFEALLRRQLQARIDQHGVQPGQGDMAMFIHILQGEVENHLRESAARGDFEFAKRVFGVLGTRTGLSYMELCTVAHRPDAAVQHFTDIVRSNTNPTQRHRQLADALDDMSEVDTTPGGGDLFIGFTREIVRYMERQEGASAAGQASMQRLGEELSAGFHQQERDVRNWDRDSESDESTVSHLQVVKAELERIHRAEAILGTNHVVSLSALNAEIRAEEQREDQDD